MDQGEKIKRVAAFFLSANDHDNPYRTPAAMRTLDGLIRNQVSRALGRAATRWREAYADGHRELQRPTRDQPWPDPGQTARLNTLKTTADKLSSLSSLVSALPAPTNDRVWQRVRDTKSLLDALIDYDYSLADHAQRLDDLSQQSSTLPSDQSSAAMIQQIEQLLRERASLIASVP